MTRDILSEVTEFSEHELHGGKVRVPVLYRRLDAFFAVFGASHKALLSIMPSPRLHPVKVWPGRGAVGVMAFNYIDTDIGPYGELGIGVLCECRHQGRSLYGNYVYHLPVTTEIAREGGVSLWGYPKFICEMEFKNDGAEQSVRLTQGDEFILSLKVKKAGLGLKQAPTTATFTVKDGELIHTPIVAQAVFRAMPQGLAKLETGHHEVGLDLARLGLGERPMLTGEMLDARMVLPEGQSLGSV